jgi:hypothetical protein
MRFVYDLQLDREISARREYELAVETKLRRQLSGEVRAQAADEMAALRAELASLRTQLEVMLGTDLGHRPALEGERIAVPMPAAPDRVESRRVTMVAEEYVTYADDSVTESPILDVPEEPLTPVEDVAEETLAPPAEPQYPAEHRGTHWRPEPQAPVAQEQYAPPPVQYAPPPIRYAPPPSPPSQPQPEIPWRPPEVRLGRHANSDGAQRPDGSATPQPPRGRHWVPPEPPPEFAGRHRGAAEPVVEQTGAEASPVAESAVEEPEGQHAGGQSLSDLLSRFNVSGPVGGGGRRRRDD